MAEIRPGDLNKLRQQEEAAYNRQAEAWDNLVKARKATNKAYRNMEEAWQQMLTDREIMKHEFEIYDACKAEIQPFWNHFKHIRSINEPKMEALREEASEEHFKMKMAIKRAEKKCRNGEDASAEREEAKIHETRRNELNAQVRELKQEIKCAKLRAKEEDEKVDRSCYEEATERYNNSKARHQDLAAHYKAMKAWRTECEKEYEEASTEHKRIKVELQRFIKLYGVFRPNKA
ncbi:hypothetical protein IKF67_01870 [Candidatus Saccharibacteria bacterium]|nr:hypothetical protein [Candidatus Saccharibacteria bacterium]